MQTSTRFVDIDAELAGQRLDNFLISSLKGLPKSRIYRIIRRGEVRINGGRGKPSTRLAAGDRVRIPPVAHLPRRSEAVGSFHDLDALVLFENEDLLVINKPAGMAVHGGSGVSAGVIESLRRALPGGRKLELAHRLDRGTSGCLMVARRRPCLRLLQDALRRPGLVRKYYLAIVHGRWPDGDCVVAQPLLTLTRAGRERVTRVDPAGKAAATRFRFLAAAADASLVAARPMTGRTHQVRVHARWARHPLFGDERYGDRMLDRSAGAGSRLALHAFRLEIPALAEFPEISVQAPLDAEMAAQTGSRFGLNEDAIQELMAGF